MLDHNNMLAPAPARIKGFDDCADRYPYRLDGTNAVSFRIFLSQPSTGIAVGLPTWCARGCSAEVSVYRWDECLSQSLLSSPLFSVREENIADCEIRTFPFGRELERGEYLFRFSDGGTGDGASGLWIFRSGVSEGTLYLGDSEESGEPQIFFDFSCTPRTPFSDPKGSIRIEPTNGEKKLAQEHFRGFLGNPAEFPFEITIGGEKHRGFDASFRLLTIEKDSDDRKETTRMIFRHTSGLLYVLTASIWYEYAAYEWTAMLVNDTDRPSPVISEWYPASPAFSLANPVLNGINGDGGFCNDPYAPYSIRLTESDLAVSSPSGRSTYQRFPYFNVSSGTGGVFFIVGWPGKWEASFSSHGAETVLKCRQQTLNASIPPHEKFIAPTALFLEYKSGDSDRAANLWRHFFIDCCMKREGEKLFAPHISGGTSWIYSEMKDATDGNQIDGIRTYLEHRIPIDYWWMDAGWYYKTGEESLEDWLPVGTWVVDRKRFPSGMKAISDYGHSVGVKTLLWFEPEVCRLPVEQFGDTSIKKEWLIPGSVTKLADIGNPDFRDFMLGRVFSIMEEGGIDLYRQDYGVGYPTSEMHAADPEGQSGYIENRYFIGYYDYLDRIAKHWPDKMIDVCAAGGGRNDLTTMRRGVPLHKTDADYSDYTMKTSMHQGLFAWLPYFGTPISGPGPYMNHPDSFIMRSNFCPWLALGADVRNPEAVDWETIRNGCEEWKQIKDYFYADYYPLLPWNNSKREWRGWEFFDPDKEEGFLEIIRDEQSPDGSRQIRLRGLRACSDYRLTDLDGDVIYSTGFSLMQDGILFSMEKRSVRIVLIQKVTCNE